MKPSVISVTPRPNRRRNTKNHQSVREKRRNKQNKTECIKHEVRETTFTEEKTTGQKIEPKAEKIGNTVTEEATEEYPKGTVAVGPNGTLTPNKPTNEQQQVSANNRRDIAGTRIVTEIKENLEIREAQEAEDTPTVDDITTDSKTSRRRTIHNRRMAN